MMRSHLLALGVLVLSSVAQAAPATPAPRATSVHTVVQRRAVFDLVGTKTELRPLCDGHEALQVELKRTAADVAAAVFSGLWYTPVHLRVTCAVD